MDEQLLKFLCKFIVENGNRPLLKEQKELLKQAIDNARSYEELAAIALSILQ